MAQNIAINKSYTLSTLPNYQPYTQTSIESSLTDGLYSTKNYWTNPATLGWNRVPVTITIDLNQVQPVSEITLSTVQFKKIGISFPQNIYIFLSIDNHAFSYAGDAVGMESSVDGFKLQKISLNNINSYARYVSITIIPDGKLLFCDEIEVLKGNAGNAVETGIIIKERLSEAVDSLRYLQFHQKNLELKIHTLGELFPGEVRKDIPATTEALHKKNLSENNLKEIEEELGRQFALKLSGKFNTPYIIEKYSPWDSLSEIHVPKGDRKSLKYDFLIPEHGVQYGAFVITNILQTPQQISFFIQNNDRLSSVEAFAVPYVPTANNASVPDPFFPLKETISLTSGKSRLFIFKVTANDEGKSVASVSIHSKTKKNLLQINTNIVQALKQSRDDSLNTINWAYLNRPMLKDRKAAAASDLQQHHINTIVVPPAFIPRVGDTDFSELVNYLSNFRYAKNILLFTSYTNAGIQHSNKAVSFMSPEWKNDFIGWYQQMLAALQADGISAQIYFYPYDEVHGKYIQEFKNLLTWAKQAVPGFHSYATLSTEEAIDAIAPYVNVAQISFRFLQKRPKSNAQIWLYGGSRPARSSSPYAFYRLLAWRAFVNDITGIGFWTYTEGDSKEELNLLSQAFIRSAFSYSVIYNGPDQEIISSRRWEAFRLGIEDYSILKAYAKKFGIQKAKLLAQQVIDTPGDVNKADDIREKILKENIGL
jgi:hypothetical protein